MRQYSELVYTCGGGGGLRWRMHGNGWTPPPERWWKKYVRMIPRWLR